MSLDRFESRESLEEYTKFLQSIVTAGYGVPTDVIERNFRSYVDRVMAVNEERNEVIHVTVVNAIGHSKVLYSLIDQADTIETILPYMRFPYGFERKTRRDIKFFYIVRELHMSNAEWRKRVVEACESLKQVEKDYESLSLLFDDVEVERIYRGNDTPNMSTLSVSEEQIDSQESTSDNSDFDNEITEEKTISKRLNLTKDIVLKDFLTVNGKIDHSLLNYSDCGVYNIFFCSTFPKEWREFMEMQEDNIKEISVSLALDTGDIRPPLGKIINPFCLTAPDKIRVIIIGQDPYPGRGHAMGLSFSVGNNVKCPQSLGNIKKALGNDGYKVSHKVNDLSCWAKQGVLLLNAALTFNGDTKAGIPLWKKFTNGLIRYICSTQRDICFFLWGGFANKFASLVDTTRGHFIISSLHPSNLANNPKPEEQRFWNLGLFKKYNEEIENRGLGETHTIDWSIIR